VSGSGHFAGFIGQYQFDSLDNGVSSLYNWDNGLPSYPLPPQIDPSFSNNNTVDHWQLADAARAPESYYWTFSAQRQMSTNTVFEVAYNANVGAHLQTGLVNLNQVKAIVPWFGGRFKLVMRNPANSEVELSRAQARVLRRRMHW
jgi:hypothetical protein